MPNEVTRIIKNTLRRIQREAERRRKPLDEKELIKKGVPFIVEEKKERAQFMQSDHGHGRIYYGVSLDGKLICQDLDYDTAIFIVDKLNAP